VGIGLSRFSFARRLTTVQRIISQKIQTLTLVLCAGLLLTGGVHAEKPAWAGGGKPEQYERKDKGHGAKERGGAERVVRDGGHDGGRSGASAELRFGDSQRTIIREFYSREVSAGRCPPGLAKKGNGCMPPGQAKKWARGRPLPRDVRYYDLPPSVVVELGVPPAGHRFVRVASDILLIAIGTGMVVDAIEDLGGM